MDRIRVAIVGTGIGRTHADAFVKLSDRFEVVAVGGTVPDDVAALARRCGALAVGNLDEVLALSNVDVVDLCTPPAFHEEHVVKSLEAGFDVICEKPLAGSVAGVDRIAAAAERTGRKVMPVFQYRFEPGMQRALAVVESGLAGAHRLSTAETLWNRGAAYYSVPWRGRRDIELGGVMLCHAIHVHDMLNSLTPKVAGVFGRIATRVNPIETEDTATASLLLEDGSFANLSATLGSFEELTRLRLQFEHVTLESSGGPYNPGAEPWRLQAADPARQREIDRLWNSVRPQFVGFAGQFSRLYTALVDGGALPVSIADARRALELVSAIYGSARSRSEVLLPIGEHDPLYQGWN